MGFRPKREEERMRVEKRLSSAFPDIYCLSAAVWPIFFFLSSPETVLSSHRKTYSILMSAVYVTHTYTFSSFVLLSQLGLIQMCDV
jgi:hypothetical protein